MNIQQVIETLKLTVITNSKDFSTIEPSCGYTSDLLSCVMAGATHHSLWITLQAHSNIVAVASLLELSAVIITEAAQPDEATITKANQENIILLGTDQPTFSIIGQLWEMGLRCQPKVE